MSLVVQVTVALEKACRSYLELLLQSFTLKYVCMMHTIHVHVCTRRDSLQLLRS